MPRPRLATLTLLVFTVLISGCAKFIPEDERNINVCVIGLEAVDGAYLGLPRLHAEGKSVEDWNRVNHELFTLEFETEHGALLRLLPPETRLCVAFPGAAGGGSGAEMELFRGYLRDSLGWDEAQIARRVMGVEVPEALVWTQDFAEMVGKNWQGRRLLRVGPSDNQVYQGFAASLEKSLPSEFSVDALPKAISAEGGDLAMTRFPDGRVGLVLGRHRVQNYLLLSGHGVYNQSPVPMDLIEEARKAYADAYGVPAIICPVKPLLEGWDNDDLFHLDMVAAFSGAGGAARAFVPEVLKGAFDRFYNKPIAAPQIKAWNRELDQAALELKDAGFRVSRLPLDDHPTRSPANSVKYRDARGKSVVMLAKYPTPLEGPGLAQRAAVDRLRKSVLDWDLRPGESSLKAMEGSVQALRQARETAAAADNPGFEAQAQIYRQAGLEVQAVPDFPWGAGSLHCQCMH